MSGLAVDCLARAALALALFATPWLVVQAAVPRLAISAACALTGAVGVGLSVVVCLGLHVAGVAICPASLALTHAATFGVALAACRKIRGAVLPHIVRSEFPLLWMGAGLALLVVPWTHLAGIDTYKWVDLATSVRVEGRIPWLVHPLSLFGFTPRAYPSAQPLLLATIQMLGGVGVEGGFFLMSVYSGLLGLFAMHALASRLFARPSVALVATAAFVFSPVFVRYNHWATGRGLFVSLLPLFLLGLTEASPARAVSLCLLTAPLLALAHKAGLVALLVVPAAMAVGWLMSLRPGRTAWAVLIGLSLSAAVALSPPILLPGAFGQPLGFLRFCITRFGWMAPAALAGAWMAGGAGSGDRLAAPARRLLGAGMAVFPLAFLPEGYGALVALPLVTVAATVGVSCWAQAQPRAEVRLLRSAVVLSLASAVVIVAGRCATAMSRPLWRAAQFIERYDPRGPFMIHASAPLARSRVQGYVSGCPRFTVDAGVDAVAVAAPPSLRGAPREVAARWTIWLRGVFSLADVEVAFYGTAPRAYYVVVDGLGEKPAGARLLHADGGVEVYVPREQMAPDAKALEGEGGPQAGGGPVWTR